jgi:predicted Rossmann fold flavoprotein
MIYDLIVIGAGAAGIMAAITASTDNKKVLLLEKLPTIASKLKATGGGRCNITNTLSNEEFMQRFGRDGRFMQDALKVFNHKQLIKFLKDIGVDTHAPDGFRVFPITHNSQTIIDALHKKMQYLHIDIKLSQKVEDILIEDDTIKGVKTKDTIFEAKKVVLASGGLGFPTLGAEGDGFGIAESYGHKITSLYPAMLPLFTKENWVENCRADTIAKATIKVDMKKHKKLQACGDLIFTKNGIRGPVVLDFAREITPLIDKYGEVPIVINLNGGMDEDKILSHLKKQDMDILDAISTIVPASVAKEICKILQIDTNLSLSKLEGIKKAKLISILSWTPLTVVGHGGFKNAMITRGGISLKEIDPKTMQSKIVDGLYFCGEIMDIDGPCGGYNLQWSFSSGYLAGKLL